MIRLVGYSCNPLTSYLPRVGVRVVIVSIVAHLRMYKYLPASVVQWVRVDLVVVII